MIKLTKNVICIFSIFLLMLFACNQSNDKSHIEYYKNGNKKVSSQIVNNKKNGVTIFYYDNGIVESLENYINDTINGEVFFFYPNGVLQQKSIMNMGISDGPAYAFYPNGSIKEYRNWIKGNKEGYGEDYWGKDGLIKAVYFSQHDTLTYERLFDSSGVVIKTQGKVPLETNSKVN